MILTETELQEEEVIQHKKLDYSLKTAEERTKFVDELLPTLTKEQLKNEKYIEILWNYIVSAMTPEEKKEKLGKIEGNFPIAEKDKILNEGKDKDNRDSYVEADQFFYFDKNKGFFLNGEHLKIYGACQHHDLGAFGSAFDKNAFDKKARRTVESR